MLDTRAMVAVAAGGAIGSVARYALQSLVAERFAPAFPLATLGINVAGSFLIGLVAELAMRHGSVVTPLVRVFLAVGILGGFTTFSSFSLETVALVRSGLTAPAVGYAIGSVVAGVAAAAAGIAAGRGTA